MNPPITTSQHTAMVKNCSISVVHHRQIPEGTPYAMIPLNSDGVDAGEWEVRLGIFRIFCKAINEERSLKLSTARRQRPRKQPQFRKKNADTCSTSPLEELLRSRIHRTTHGKGLLQRLL